VRWLALLVVAACWREQAVPRAPAPDPSAEPSAPATPTIEEVRSRSARLAPATSYDPVVQAIGQMREFADQACACSDPACSHQVMDDVQKWFQDSELRSLFTHPSADVTEEDRKRIREATERLLQCAMRSMSPQSSPPPPPSP
jgi:hypothetical protein